MRALSFFPLLCLLLSFSRADALFGYIVGHCQFTSSDDLVYLAQVYFNKRLLGEYNSTVGKYTGYTEKAREITDGFNKNPKMLKQEKKNYEDCKTLIPLILDLNSKTAVEPSVTLRSVEAEYSKHSRTLICSAYKFFPKQIRVTWLRNGKEMTSDVTSTEEMPNGSWLYQIHSILEYTPSQGETITCKVEHASLREPQLHEWVPTPESQRNKYAVGSAGLLLGAVIFFAGLIYYMKNASGRMLVPTS